MSILQSIILGIIQGLTEFFPVSSSGHLVIIPYFLNWDYVPLYYTITVHFATLVALLTVFYREIYRIIRSLILAVFVKSQRNENNFKLGIFIIVASIPSAAIGFLLERYIQDLFTRPILVAFFLVVTAAVLWLGELRGKNVEVRIKGRNSIEYWNKNSKSNSKKDYNIIGDLNLTGSCNGRVNFNLFISLIVGIGQALAILPGISRSGATISFARFFGIKRSESVKFSFLLSMPVIFGSFVFELFKSYNIIFNNDFLILRNLIIGFIFSYISGLFAIRFLIRYTRNKNLNVFAVYCIGVAIAIFVFYFFKKF